MYQDTSTSLSVSSYSAATSIRKAREVFFHWMLTMPDHTSPVIEARKILASEDSHLTDLPSDVQQALKQMLHQVVDNIAATQSRQGRRRRRMN